MIKKITHLALIVLVTIAVQAETSIKIEIPSSQKVMHTEVDSFKVWGNCGMCKRTIESALKEVNGVVSATWNVDTKMLHIEYNPHNITLTEVKQKIADVGYDTEAIKAKKEDYDDLPGCCQYERE